MSNGSDDWFNLPRPAQGIKLYQIREEMRQKNLADTEEPPLETSTSPPAGDVYNVRTSDGTYNDLKCPRMGSTGMRFGRNVPLSEAFPDTANLLKPSPRQVSLELLTRTTFQPATILNVIAAAWIQFMVHDWFMHKKGTWSHTHDIPVGDADTWHEKPMRVPKTPADAPKVEGSKRPPAYVNENSHWWDGSQLYGSSPASQASLRAGRDGKVLVSPSGRLGVDPVTGKEITGFTENGWVGLSLLHGMFALEHNAVCDHLKKHNTKWDDERLFQQARLVLSALLAKIHTVEWSCAILPKDVLSTGLRTNWYGRFSKLQNVFPKLADNDIFSGIPGSPTEHHDWHRLVQQQQLDTVRGREDLRAAPRRRDGREHRHPRQRDALRHGREQGQGLHRGRRRHPQHRALRRLRDAEGGVRQRHEEFLQLRGEVDHLPIVTIAKSANIENAPC